MSSSLSMALRYRSLTCGMLLTTLLVLPVKSQTNPDSNRVVKGSYLHYGHAVIEDNSMLLEEAFNQGPGIIQFISGTLVADGTVETAFEAEIPIAGERHQISFGSSYFSTSDTAADTPEGLGEIRVSYRPQISGKHRWAMIIPRLTIAIPRKNNVEEFQYRRPDLEVALAITKRLHGAFTSHFNAGTTYRFDHRSKFFAYTFAGSVIWAVRPRFNFMLESVYKKSMRLTSVSAETIINPAFRFSFPAGNYQVIPGIGAPVCITANSQVRPGVFIYLSIEPF